MALTQTQRFDAIEEDINRILEHLASMATTVDTGIEYVDLEDAKMLEMVKRISLLEKRLASCQKKLDIIKSKKIR